METAPKDGSWVLLSSDDDQNSYIYSPFIAETPLHVVTARWNFDAWDHHYNDGMGHNIDSPTGWMPLPEQNRGGA
jgi:hypothetical protein